MITKAGLWIDHEKAIVVAVTEKGEETKLIILTPFQSFSRKV